MSKKYPEVEKLKRLIKYYLYIALFSLVFYCVYVFFKNDLLSAHVCQNIKCAVDFIDLFGGIFGVIEFLVKILISFVTIYGIIAALNNYLNTIHTSRTNIHLTHLSSFQQFVQSEIEYYSTLSAKSFNLIKWYKCIFVDSIEGNITASESYKKTIKKINEAILNSNKLAEGKIKGHKKDFDYKKHQTRMIKEMSNIGITISRLNRRDFGDLEEDLFDLIDKVNIEFCNMDVEMKLDSPKYV